MSEVGREASHAERRAARTAARLAAVQALYQMDMVQTGLDEVIEEFVSHRLGHEVEGERYITADEDHFTDIVRGVVREQRDIDGSLNERLAAGWALARVDSTLRAILRAGAYELRRCKDIPAKVILNEYVEIARAFFDGDEPGVVNAVLDRLGKSVRSGELNAD